MESKLFCASGFGSSDSWLSWYGYVILFYICLEQQQYSCWTLMFLKCCHGKGCKKNNGESAVKQVSLRQPYFIKSWLIYSRHSFNFIAPQCFVVKNKIPYALNVCVGLHAPLPLGANRPSPDVPEGQLPSAKPAGLQSTSEGKEERCGERNRPAGERASQDRERGMWRGDENSALRLILIDCFIILHIFDRKTNLMFEIIVCLRWGEFFFCVQLLRMFFRQQDELRRLKEELTSKDVRIRQLELELNNLKNFSPNNVWPPRLKAWQSCFCCSHFWPRINSHLSLPAFFINYLCHDFFLMIHTMRQKLLA